MVKVSSKLCCRGVSIGTVLVATVCMAVFFFSGVFANTGDSHQSKRATAQKTTDAQKSLTLPQDKDDSGFLQSSSFNFGVYDDTVLGFIADGKVARYIGATERNAVAIEVAGGPNVIRVNSTYGLALTEQQRVKLTYEFLDENLDFSFPDDTVSKWVYQHALGGDYAYLLDNAYIESIGFGGYYTHSSSKDLTQEHRIAGANSGNTHADVSLRLWPYSRLTA